MSVIESNTGQLVQIKSMFLFLSICFNKCFPIFIVFISINNIFIFDEGFDPHTHQKVQGGRNEYKNFQLIHILCHIEYHKAFPAKREITTKAQIF